MLFLFNRNKFAQLIIDVISRVSFARRALLNQLPQSTNDFLILQEKIKRATTPTPRVWVQDIWGGRGELVGGLCEGRRNARG